MTARHMALVIWLGIGCPAAAPAFAETDPPAPAAAGLVAADAALAAGPPPDGGQLAPNALAALLREADAWLLAGRNAPPELPRLLANLHPADRLTALAYMRRTGVFEGPAMDVTVLLSPDGAAR